MVLVLGAATVALSPRVYLFTPSVTVYVVVCVRLLTCVSHAVASDELWRFNTSKRAWDRVDNTGANGIGPTGRYDHVMTSVGDDLWLHGGYSFDGGSLGDLWRFSTRTHGWELVHDRPELSDILDNGPVPSPRYTHAMTSVGQDLWMYGGEAGASGEGDTCSSPAALLQLLR